MAPIYKLWMASPTAAYWRLPSKSETPWRPKSQTLASKSVARRSCMCTPMWSAEQWAVFGVEEFPNIEAVQRYSEFLFDWTGRVT